MDLFWVEDLLPEGYLKKRMFGGFAYYLDDKLVLVLFESEGNRAHRGVEYDFEIWNGCLIPTEREWHSQVEERFPFLIHHPVLPKWFYLPLEAEDFESHVQILLREIRRRNQIFGVVPKARRSKVKESSTRSRMDTRRPMMFSEAVPEDQLEKAKRISDLKNLGPESEKAFLKAGIRTPHQFAKMGWKKAMTRLYDSNPRNGHSIFAYAVIGALQNKMWSRISEDDKKEARAFMKSLREKKMPKRHKKPRRSVKS